MSIQASVLILAILSTLLPVGAVVIRGRSRQMTVATLLVAVSVSAALGFALRMLQLESWGPNIWVFGLMATGVPILLSGYLLSVGFGRENPEESLRHGRRTFVLLGVVGIALVLQLPNDHFVSGYSPADGHGTIFVGWLGKAYFTYLLIGIILIGQSLEKTFRLAEGDLRHRLRFPFLGFFSVLVFATFILTTGMLYSSIGMGKIVAFSLPVTFAAFAIGYGYLRGGIMDVAAPVSRNVVYSSFTAFAAGLFVIAIGIAAQIATRTGWSPDEILVLSTGFLAVLLAVLLLFSNRFQRTVRRFIDRNFYVNRYDYRTQWSAVTAAFVDASTQEEVIERAARVLKETFLADEVTIALLDRAEGMIRPVHGTGTGSRAAVLEPDTPLFDRLLRGRKSLLISRKADDLVFLPINAENSNWLDETASQVVGPLLIGDELIGVVGLERDHKDDAFTFEDTSLLDSVAAHIGSTLQSNRLAEELADTREMELMSQWSSMILHDLKNYLTPLRMVSKNLVEKQSRPGIAELCARDLSMVADKMEALVQTLGQLRENPQNGRARVEPNELIRTAISDLGVEDSGIEVSLQLESAQSLYADPQMLRRVFENLITNAVEAMKGAGTLTIESNDCDYKSGPSVCFDVRDTGAGMDAEFVRDQLFRPFATTKKKGLGLGLYQCRSIIRQHGGDLTVRSRVGEGTNFRVALPAEAPSLEVPRKSDSDSGRVPESALELGIEPGSAGS